MLIDTHVHLDMQDFDQDRGAVLKRAKNWGLRHMVAVGIDLPSSQRATQLAEDYGCVSAAVGSHPHHAEGCTPSIIDHLAQLASHPRVVAWGEIGLDFYRKAASPEAQLESFQRQLETACDLCLPVVIHDREAHQDVRAALHRVGRKDRAGVIHCFSGTLELALELMGLGYLISIAGTVTYPHSSRLKEVAASLPLDGLVLETDAPFLSPVPKRGKRNEPGFVAFTAREVARLRNMDWEELAWATTRNAVNLFSLPKIP